ncbi:MAG: YceH family protein [Betaproteobacteria bacterium]|nr:YceH family protein [Betaproteobacteria bacterium]
MSSRALPHLSLIEARVLGVLVEKQHTVPDTYPLSLNALVAGCNQRSSRDPVLNASEAEVQEAVDSLRARDLVIESSGSRVARHSHNMGRVLQLPPPAVALLATLMLRGSQTAGELRINSERLYRFADISTVEAFLQELAGRSAGAMVVELARRPGERENRWAHLLSGMQTVEDAALAEEVRAGMKPAGDGAQAATLQARVLALETEVAVLRSTLAHVCEALGIAV